MVGVVVYARVMYMAIHEVESLYIIVSCLAERCSHSIVYSRSYNVQTPSPT